MRIVNEAFVKFGFPSLLKISLEHKINLLIPKYHSLSKADQP